MRNEDDEDSEYDEDTNDDPRLMAQRLDAQASVEKSGMKLEEYFTFGIALAADALGATFADQFGGADESSLTYVRRANLQFVRKRMQEKYSSLAEDEASEDQ